MPTSVDNRLLNIVKETLGVTVQQVSQFTRRCKLGLKIDHVAVVCLEREGLGVIFEYVSSLPRVTPSLIRSFQCLMHNGFGCAVGRCRVQAEQANLDRMRERADLLRDPPVKFGGWVLMGAVPELYAPGPESAQLRQLLEQRPGSGVLRRGRTVLVETLFFVTVRKSLF